MAQSDDDFKAFYDEVTTMAGEVPTDVVVARIRRQVPDLESQFALMGYFAFTVRALLQLDDPLDQARALALLEIMVALAEKEH